jgi:subtilisin-like proprotein convertase family protein
MVLYPPSGSGILLSAYNKINNYNPISGINYTFSNRARPGVYLNNKSNIDPYVNILDKTSIYNTQEQLSASLLGCQGISPSGDWKLVIYDNDLQSSGTLDAWNLILTYEPYAYEENI